MTESGLSILPTLRTTIKELAQQFDLISEERKVILSQLTDYVKQKNKIGQAADLNFICTHNSRRSQTAQLWAQTAAYYCEVKNVRCFSGGTEATSFNPRAVKSLREAGFDISIWKAGENPIYELKFSVQAPAVRAFSKTFNDPSNPKTDFVAVMTCSHADQNCPLVSGASKRIALTYDDPKDFDGTAQESEKYRECIQKIGREILYAFSQV
jgi:arsenate reductase